jgi:surface protein
LSWRPSFSPFACTFFAQYPIFSFIRKRKGGLSMGLFDDDGLDIDLEPVGEESVSDTEYADILGLEDEESHDDEEDEVTESDDSLDEDAGADDDQKKKKKKSAQLTQEQEDTPETLLPTQPAVETPIISDMEGWSYNSPGSDDLFAGFSFSSFGTMGGDSVDAPIEPDLSTPSTPVTPTAEPTATADVTAVDEGFGLNDVGVVHSVAQEQYYDETHDVNITVDRTEAHAQDVMRETLNNPVQNGSAQTGGTPHADPLMVGDIDDAPFTMGATVSSGVAVGDTVPTGATQGMETPTSGYTSSDMPGAEYQEQYQTGETQPIAPNPFHGMLDDAEWTAFARQHNGSPTNVEILDWLMQPSSHQATTPTQPTVNPAFSGAQSPAASVPTGETQGMETPTSGYTSSDTQSVGHREQYQTGNPVDGSAQTGETQGTTTPTGGAGTQHLIDEDDDDYGSPYDVALFDRLFGSQSTGTTPIGGVNPEMPNVTTTQQNPVGAVNVPTGETQGTVPNTHTTGTMPNAQPTAQTGATQQGGTTHATQPTGATASKVAEGAGAVAGATEAEKAEPAVPSLVSGDAFNSIVKKEFGGVTRVEFSDKTAPAGVTVRDMTTDSSGKYVAWRENGTLFVSSQVAGAKVLANGDMNGMFQGMTSLKVVSLAKLDTSGTTSMKNLFFQATSLEKGDFQTMDMRRVTDIDGIFAHAESLKTLDLGGWKTGNVTSAYSAFHGMKRLETLNISEANFSCLINGAYMISENPKLKSVSTAGWQSGNLIAMDGMFSGNPKLETVNLSGLDTRKVETMTAMFSGDKSLISFQGTKLEHLRMDSVYRANGILDGCDSINPEWRKQYAQRISKVISRGQSEALKLGKITQADLLKSKLSDKELDDLIVKQQGYKFVPAGEGKTQKVGLAGSQSIRQVVAQLKNKALDEDQKKGMQDVDQMRRAALVPITILGAKGALSAAKNMNRHVEASARTADALIKNNVITLSDLSEKSKDDLAKIFSKASKKSGIKLSSKEAKNLLKYRQQAQDIITVRDKVITRIDTGIIEKVSIKTDTMLRGTRFVELGSRETSEMLDLFFKSSTNPTLKKLNVSSLDSKDIARLLRHPEKYNLSSDEIAALRVQKLVAARKKVASKTSILNKAKNISKNLGRSIVAGTRVLSSIINKADSTAGAGLNSISTTASVIVYGKSAIKAGLKGGRASARLANKITKKTGRAINKLPPVKATRKGLNKVTGKVGSAISNSAPVSATRRAKQQVKADLANRIQKNKKIQKIRKRKEEYSTKRLEKKKSRYATKKHNAEMRRKAMDRLKASRAGRAAAKVSSGVSKITSIVTTPFRAVNALVQAISKAILWICGAIACIALFYLLLLFIFNALLGASQVIFTIVSSVMGFLGGSDSSITEEDGYEMIRAAYYSVIDRQSAVSNQVYAIGEGVPADNSVKAGHTVSQYGYVDVDGNYNQGYTVHYQDGDGNEVTGSINNQKDVVVMAYVMMGDNFFTDDAAREALIADLNSAMNPSPTSVENPTILFCPSGCEELTYACNNTTATTTLFNDYANGMILKSGALTRKAYGEYYESVCNGHTIRFIDADGNTLIRSDGTQAVKTFYHNTRKGETPAFAPASQTFVYPAFVGLDGTSYSATHFTMSCAAGAYTITGFCDADYCGNYTAGHNHSITVCYGHRSVDIYVKRYTIEDMVDSGKWSTLYNASYYSYLTAFAEDGGWTAENIEWAESLRDADWAELYNITTYDTATVLVGGSADLTIWVYFKNQGYSDEAVAGILGNLHWESGGLDSSLIEAGSGAGHGLAQWTGSRWSGVNGLQSYANSRGVEWTDFATQLDFLNWELEHGGQWLGATSLNQFKNMTDVATATETFMNAFERPGIPHLEERKSLAQSYYEKYHGMNATATAYVNYLVALAADDTHGYSQYSSDGGSGRCLNPDVDCSSFIYYGLLGAGFSKTVLGSYPFSTSNMGDILKSAGFTELNYTSAADLQVGDILVNTGSHAEVYIGNYQTVGAHSNRDGAVGDSSGTEVSVVTISSSWRPGTTKVYRLQ